MSQPHDLSQQSGADSTGSVLGAPTPQELRDELAQLVVTDLLGPIGGPEEELRGNPAEHYIIGRLAPGGGVVDGRPKLTGLPVEPSDFDETGLAAIPDAEEGDPDPESPNVPSLQPSSLGLTVRWTEPWRSCGSAAPGRATSQGRPTTPRTRAAGRYGTGRPTKAPWSSSCWPTAP